MTAGSVLTKVGDVFFLRLGRVGCGFIVLLQEVRLRPRSSVCVCVCVCGHACVPCCLHVQRALPFSGWQNGVDEQELQAEDAALLMTSIDGQP